MSPVIIYFFKYRYSVFENQYSNAKPNIVMRYVYPYFLTPQIKYYINKRDVTGLYCRARANIHIAVIKTAAFTPPSVFVLFRNWEESMQHIFTYSSKHSSAASGSFGWVWSAVFSWIASRRAELQSYASAWRWSKRSIAGSYIRSYEIERLLDNKNIYRQFNRYRQNNRCSPRKNCMKVLLLCSTWKMTA